MGGQVDVQTSVYEGLLMGEQVDVQTTVYEGLLKGEQADVYTYRSSISGTNSLKFLRCNSYLRAVLMFLARVPGAAATSQGRGKQQGGRGRRERWQVGGQERNRLYLYR